MIPSSVYMIAQNNESTIDMALQSVADFAEIIVVDSNSTDNTVEIAKKYKAKVYSREFDNYSQQKEYALSLCTYDWVLNLDSDEVVPPELKKELKELTEQLTNTIVALKIKFSNFFTYKQEHNLVYKSSKVRFFNKKYGGYIKDVKVHEGIQINGKTVQSKNAILHYGERDLLIFIHKIANYSKIKTSEKIQKHKQFNLLKLLLIFPIFFIRQYFLRRYIFSGISGFIASVTVAFSAFLKEAYLYEHKNKLNVKDKNLQQIIKFEQQLSQNKNNGI